MEDNPFPGDDYLPPYDLPTREPATPEQAVGSTSRDQEITRQAIDSDPVAKQNLQSILAAVKDRILPDVAITVSEMETFLDKIYDEWQPRNLVPTPIRPKPKRSAQECSYEFGTFRQTASASYTERGLKRPSSGSRHRKRRATAPPSTLPDRQMGQPARLTVIYNRGRHPDGSGRWIWFSLQDRQNKHVELTTPCNYTACSREDAYLRVMQRHDSFMASGRFYHVFAVCPLTSHLHLAPACSCL